MHRLEVSLPKYLLVTEKNTVRLLEKSNRHHPKQGMNINLNSNKAGISCPPEYEAPRSTQYHFCGIFPKLHNLDLVMRNHDKPKLRDILQKN